MVQVQILNRTLLNIQLTIVLFLQVVADRCIHYLTGEEYREEF